MNTIAPFLLTRRLLPLLGASGRVINLSSAAQAAVNLRALVGEVQLSDNAAYAQSKLALTMWSRALALSLGRSGPSVVAVNPGSMLGTKMVKLKNKANFLVSYRLTPTRLTPTSLRT